MLNSKWLEKNDSIEGALGWFYIAWLGHEMNHDESLPGDSHPEPGNYGWVFTLAEDNPEWSAVHTIHKDLNMLNIGSPDCHTVAGYSKTC